MNWIFKIWGFGNNQTYSKLCHITLLTTESSIPCGPEGMIIITMPTPKVDIFVIISDIEGFCHLIEIEYGKKWLINNRIDMYIWNKVYD